MIFEAPLESLEQGSVVFCSEETDFVLPNETPIREWLRKVAQTEDVPLLELTYIFTSDEYLRQVNVAFLQHDYYTDVITFPYTPGAIHGDVFISIERVRDNAQQYGIPFEHELYRVMVHGLLHLAGYRDETEAQEAEMRKKEDEHLRHNPLLYPTA